jgi:hypothetical protein
MEEPPLLLDVSPVEIRVRHNLDERDGQQSIELKVERLDATSRPLLPSEIGIRERMRTK